MQLLLLLWLVAENPVPTELSKSLQNDTSYKVRMQAAVLLGRTLNPEVVPFLLTCLQNDSEALVRASCAMALTDFGERHQTQAAVPLIKASALDRDEVVRVEAARAVRQYVNPETLPFVAALYTSPDEAIRKAVVEYAAIIPEAAAALLLRALGDTPKVAEVAILAAARKTDALSFLQNAADHPQSLVRRRAVEALALLATKTAAAQIVTIYQRPVEADEVRKACKEALRLLKPVLSLDQLVLDAEQGELKVRSRALELLGILGGSQAEAQIRQALVDPDLFIRGVAVQAVRDSAQSTFVPELTQMLEDPQNQRLRVVLKNALEEISKGKP